MGQYFHEMGVCYIVRAIAIIIRRQRMQETINQRELDAILTDKQKALLQDWRKRRLGANSKDSLMNKP